MVVVLVCDMCVVTVLDVHVEFLIVRSAYVKAIPERKPQAPPQEYTELLSITQDVPWSVSEARPPHR